MVYSSISSLGGRPFCGMVFSTKGPHFGEHPSGVVPVDGVEDAFVADLCLGDEADPAAQVWGAGEATQGGGRPDRPGPLTFAWWPHHPLLTALVPPHCHPRACPGTRGPLLVPDIVLSHGVM